MSLKKVIVWSLVRRVLGYLGIAGVVGIENDIATLGGAVLAVGTVGWSIIEKIRADKS